MNVGPWLEALALPAECVSKKPARVPKALLAGLDGLTATDRRQMKEGLGELRHVATVQPEGAGIPPHEEEGRSFLDLPVMTLEAREGGKPARLAALLHRAMAHHAVVLCLQGSQVWMSLARKRAHETRAGAWGLEGEPLTVPLPQPPLDERGQAFRDALALREQPLLSLRTLYEGWWEALVAWQVSAVTGRYERVSSPEAVRSRAEALESCERLAEAMKRLRADADREKQLRRLVDLNAELKRLEAAHSAARARL